MRLLSTILSLYILSLAINPCVYTWKSNVDVLEKTINLPQHSNDSCNQHCHPFCTDNCCVNAVDEIPVVYYTFFVHSILQRIQSKYVVNYVHRIYEKCWRPPEILIN